MKKKYFNKKAKRRAKINLRLNADRKRRFSKRMGGIAGVTVMEENRDVNAMDISGRKNQVE